MTKSDRGIVAHAARRIASAALRSLRKRHVGKTDVDGLTCMCRLPAATPSLRCRSISFVVGTVARDHLKGQGAVGRDGQIVEANPADCGSIGCTSPVRKSRRRWLTSARHPARTRRAEVLYGEALTGMGMDELQQGGFQTLRASSRRGMRRWRQPQRACHERRVARNGSWMRPLYKTRSSPFLSAPARMAPRPAPSSASIHYQRGLARGRRAYKLKRAVRFDYVDSRDGAQARGV